MVPIVERKGFLASKRLSHFLVVDLVLNHAVSEGSACCFVVRDANEVTGIALVDQLGDGASRKQRNVVRVRLHGREHLSFMWLAGTISFDNQIVCIGVVIRGRKRIVGGAAVRIGGWSHIGREI